MKSSYLVLCCAVLGGCLGYLAFFWLVGQGLYGLVLPGGALGMMAGIPRNQSKVAAIACGLLALLLGLFTEWRFAPMKVDDGFGYFLTQVHRLKPVTLLMIAVGGAIGFWIPFRRVADTADSHSAS
ncbi:MAG: hypothetical protein NT069_25755 [Planctomycetota bacterium]|nr:hypothetical protein [Planctomycetota bacterium]